MSALGELRATWEGLRRRPFGIWLARTIRGFFWHRNLANAAALTYSTLLASVPLLAVVFAFLKAAGFSGTLRPFLMEEFAVLDEEAVDALLAYIERANTQAVGSVGLAALLLTSWGMLGNVESALNHIFGVKSARGYMQRAGEYLAMLLVGTSLVVASIGARTLLDNPALLARIFGRPVELGFGVHLVPWITAFVAFFFLYTWMPNKRTSARAAALGAIVGSVLFQGVQEAYIALQLGFARANAVYGALAQLPILLIWVYASWVVALIGAEGIAARETLHVEPLAPGERLGRELIALAALRAIVDAFQSGERTPTPQELAVRLSLDVQEVHRALQPLLDADILVEPADGRGYLPASSPQAIPLERALAALR